MPVMCTVQLPKGKKKEQIDKTLVEISDILMRNFEMQPNQVRVAVCELPRNRYIAGERMGYEMPEFDGENVP